MLSPLPSLPQAQTCHRRWSFPMTSLLPGGTVPWLSSILYFLVLCLLVFLAQQRHLRQLCCVFWDLFCLEIIWDDDRDDVLCVHMMVAYSSSVNGAAGVVDPTKGPKLSVVVRSTVPYGSNAKGQGNLPVDRQTNTISSVDRKIRRVHWKTPVDEWQQKTTATTRM